MDRISFSTPLGPMALEEEGGALTALYLPNAPMPSAGEETPLLSRGRQEVLEYLAGGRRTFDLPLCPRGTPFQLRVWRALEDIPYGQVITYGELARRVGCPLPCHRVVGAGGALTGYAGGLAMKEWLLRLEGLL